MIAVEKINHNYENVAKILNYEINEEKEEEMFIIIDFESG